jgi:hypothetical protein
MFYWELSGTDTVTPLDVQGVDANGTGTAAAASSITPSAAGGIKLAAVATSTGGFTYTKDADYSASRTGSLGFAAVEEWLNPSGAEAATFTVSSSDGWGMMSVVFKAGSDAAIPTARSRGLRPTGARKGLRSRLNIKSWF